MARQDFRAKLRKAAVQPHKIPGYLKRQVDRILNTVEGSRVVWPGPGRALLAPFQARRPGEDEILVLTHATLVSAGTERFRFILAIPGLAKYSWSATKSPVSRSATG